MRRRQFIAGVGGALTAPALAFAQSERMRVIGLLLSQSEDNREAIDRIAAVRDGLQKLGWIEGRSIQIEIRYGRGEAERMRTLAAELVALRPDALFASATSALAALHRATTTAPIVFAQVTDPVGSGFVASLARPGGNITGFTQHEFSIGLKWVELLKELAPQTARVALIYDPQNPATTGYRSLIKTGVEPFRVEVSEHPVRDAAEIERVFGAISAVPNSGVVILPGPAPSVHRDLVVSLAHRSLLPGVYPFRYWVAAGGLAFYGVDNIELHRQAAKYVDRILKGDKPGDLPIQHATRFELVINLKTAKALGVNPSTTLLARTDEVIE